MDWATERTEIMDALFGKEAVTMHYNRRTGDVVDKKWSRQPNGVWTSTSGPRYTRIVAVLVVQMLSSSSVCALQDLRLYHNPYVSEPLNANLPQIAQAVPVDQQISFTTGQSVSSILGLPHDWPVMGQKK